MKKVLKRVGVTVLCLVLAVVLVVGGYVVYLMIQYERIPDREPLAVDRAAGAMVQRGQEYRAMTYNIGFGAYDPGYSFFMDSGRMLDGTEVSGEHSRGVSAEVVQRNTDGALETAESLAPHFLLFQEVDVEAHRSYGIDQAAGIRAAFGGYDYTYASNFHTAYLFYPPTKPIGSIESGLVTLSAFEMGEAERRSFPVDESFPTRFFDLDRCFAVHRLPVEGGGELVLVNLHMSAYDEGGVVRAQQLEMLNGFLREEQAKGSWVIVGGDYNHALGGTQEAFDSGQEVPDWVSVLENEDLPEGFSVMAAENGTEVPTCRSSDMGYEPGVSYTTVVDGFIVSGNVKAAAQNIDLGFAYSDHNPVLLRFELV